MTTHTPYSRLIFLLAGLLLFARVCGAEENSKLEAAVAAEKLAELVESFVVGDEIVGAELLVVRDGTTILHRAFGFDDREAKRKMELGRFFAVRSMTKPFIGMAAQILTDEGKLELDAPVGRYLPSFDNDKCRDVTVRHLLTHRAGFPLMTEAGRPLSSYTGGLRELADMAAARGPLHQPGSRFLYSDVGSDVLGALVAGVSGQTLEEFVRKRILEPLQFAETFPEAEAVTAARRDRVPNRYMGMPGHWTRYWSHSSAPIYPFLKGSGGLYASAADYARFLQIWMDRERGASGKLLSSDAFQRALTGASRSTMSTGFPDATTDYGQMWMLYRRQGSDFAFGHSGSDGTHAYAFPQQKLIVCYFTQTRGHETAARFEAALNYLFLQPNASAFATLLKPPARTALGEFAGLYAPQNRVAALGAVVELGGTLVFEIPGRMLMRLRATDDRDRWVPERVPNDAVVFRREGDRVIGLTLHRGERVDEAQRFVPELSLPTVAELLSLRMRAAPLERVAELLPLRVTAEIETRQGKVSLTSTYGSDGRSLAEIDLGAGGKMKIWTAGQRVWRQMPGADVVTELRGPERAEYWAGSLLVELGDWTKAYREVVMIGREMLEGEDVFRVRVVPADGFASTKIVSAHTGLVLREQGFTISAGGGPQGTDSRYSDFRDLEGLRLPFVHTLRILGTNVQVLTRILTVTPRAEIDRKKLTAPGV